MIKRIYKSKKAKELSNEIIENNGVIVVDYSLCKVTKEYIVLDILESEFYTDETSTKTLKVILHNSITDYPIPVIVNRPDNNINEMIRADNNNIVIKPNSAYIGVKVVKYKNHSLLCIDRTHLTDFSNITEIEIINKNLDSIIYKSVTVETIAMHIVRPYGIIINAK